MRWSGNHPETLAGVRVVDLTRLLPGPFCSMLLADLGADVVKIEAPSGGDYARWFPPTLGPGNAPGTDPHPNHPHGNGLAGNGPWGTGSMGALFAAINRGKRSLGLDLKQERGREALTRLIATADVVLESFRPGVMERLGFGPEQLSVRHPGLVYCAISGYGQSGPYRDRAGHDLNYLALSGALEQNGPRSGAPVAPGFQPADVAGGALYAALGIVSALLHKQRTGSGAQLDIAMTEGALTLMSPLLARVGANATLPARGADQLTGGLPCYRVYETADGRFIALAALEPKFWNAFCDAVERPDWKARGHSADSPIHADVEALFRTATRDEWVQRLVADDICCEPVLNAEEVLESALMQARGAFFQLTGVAGHTSLQTASPVTPPTARLALRPPPLLGQHSVEILRSLGYGEDIVSEMVRDGATRLAEV